MSTGPGKLTFLINSLIHAREWITGATVLKIIDHVRITSSYYRVPYWLVKAAGIFKLKTCNTYMYIV